MDIHEKILNLRKLVPENGVTEAEAITALELANKLMQKYGITEAELRKVEVDKDMRHGTFDEQNKHLDPAIQLCGVMIAEFCEVTLWQNRAKNRVEFFGLIQDTMMAEFLMELVCKSMSRSWSNYLKVGEYDRSISRHKLYWSFRYGFSSRINAKLEEMIDARKPVGASTGTDLVSLKMAIVEAGLKETLPDLNIKAGRKNRAKVNLKAWMDGAAEGDKVNLNRPIEERQGRKLLS